MIGKIFLESTNRKILFLETYFYRQVIKKWNTKLSIRVILDLWSIKVKKKKKKDKIALNKSA